MTRTIAAAAIGMVAGAFLAAGVLDTRQHHLPDCETVTVKYLGGQR